MALRRLQRELAALKHAGVLDALDPDGVTLGAAALPALCVARGAGYLINRQHPVFIALRDHDDPQALFLLASSVFAAVIRRAPEDYDEASEVEFASIAVDRMLRPMGVSSESRAALEA